MKTRKSAWPGKRWNAAALVVVLATIILLAALVVSVTIAMRMERRAAHYYSERARADLLAYEAVEAAKASIQSATAPTNGWVSLPGRIISWPLSAPANFQTNFLFSGSAAAAGGNTATDMNRYVLSEDERTAVTGENATSNPMPVAWIYVFKDGFRSTDLAHTNVSPVIGRLAYWTDDESARVDVNTAWQPQAGVSAANPSRVALAAIPGFAASDIQAIATQASNMPFSSPDDARRLAGLGSILSSNRFLTTHYTHSPRLNPWGEPKIYLTTQKKDLPASIASLPARTTPGTNDLGAYSSDYFLDILPTDNADPGGVVAVDANKITVQVARLRNLLGRADWPYAPGTSFGQKFKGFDTNRTTQLAIDIIDYVRSADSTNGMVIPIRGTWTNGGFSTNGSSTFGPECVVGSSRHPVLTEMGFTVSDVPKTNAAGVVAYAFKFVVEMYLPPNYGLSNYSWPGSYVSPSIYYSPLNTNTAYQFPGVGCTPWTGSMQAGDYRVFVSGPIMATNPPITVRPTGSLGVRMAVNIGLGNSEFSPAISTGKLLVPLSPAGSYDALVGGDYSQIVTAEVDDPRVNRHADDWVVRPSGNTLGAVNSIYGSGMSAAAVPPVDGAAAAASLVMPAPAAGVSSVAELGYVTSGVEITAKGTPWRTFRLQPRTAKSTLPDWALLELFEAPIRPTNSQNRFIPRKDATFGRVNLNAASIEPFSNSLRTNVLQGVFSNAPTLSQTVIANITNHQTVAAGMLSLPDAYASPGELAEITGVADGGEASESVIRQFADLFSSRGNVYRVYAVAQALQQTPGGAIVIQAEKSVVALIERTAANGTRTIYWKALPF